MRNKIISICITLIFLFTSLISVNAIAPTPRVDLDEYQIEATDINKVYVTGTVTIGKGQLIGLYDSKGILLYNYTQVKNSGDEEDFKIQIPAIYLKTGDNTFKVKSLPLKGYVNGSNFKTLTVKIKTNKKDQNITASNIELKVGETKSINASVDSRLPLTYKSNDTSIVTIDNNGNIIGRSVGSTTIIISQSGNNTYNPVTKTIKVTVKDKESVTPTTKKDQTISSMDSYQFADVNKSKTINAKASSGLKVTYKSSNSKIVSVDRSGKMTSKNSGTAKIQVIQSGNNQYKSVTKNITVKVPKRNSYNEAMKPMEEAAIAQAKWMKNYTYSWNKWAKGSNKYTIKKSKYYGSCVTYVACVCYRLNLLKDGSGKVVFCNSNGKPWKNDYPSKYFTTYYYKGGKSVKWLNKHDKLKKGDILMYAYGSNKAGGYGNHNYIFVKYDKNNKGIVRAWSNAYASSFKDSKKGKLEKVGKAITGVVRPKTFNIDTSCTNGTITQSRLILAAQTVTIEWHPNKGKKISKIIIDGKDKTSSYKNKNKIVWNKLDSKHTIEVIYN